MYKIIKNGAEFTMPKSSLKLLALHTALENGIKSGPEMTDEYAKVLLSQFGIQVLEMAEV